MRPGQFSNLAVAALAFLTSCSIGEPDNNVSNGRARFEVESSDGKRYLVEGPEDAKKQEIVDAIMKKYGGKISPNHSSSHISSTASKESEISDRRHFIGQRVGNMTFYSDGSVTHIFDGARINSKGTMATTQGGPVQYTDGVTCQVSENTEYCVD